MRLLLDSNVLLWLIFSRRLLTDRVRQLLEDDRNEMFVSRASVWELSIKIAKGKLPMPGNSISYVLHQMKKLGIVVVSIEAVHILRTETLPHHHGDPFDRMIVAQALEEELTILTSDEKIRLYGAKVIWR